MLGMGRPPYRKLERCCQSTPQLAPLVEVTSCFVSRSQVSKLWLFLPAPLESEGTARVEATPCRRVGWRRGVALEQQSRLNLTGPRTERGRDEGLGIGMEWTLEELLGGKRATAR